MCVNWKKVVVIGLSQPVDGEWSRVSEIAGETEKRFRPLTSMKVHDTTYTTCSHWFLAQNSNHVCSAIFPAACLERPALLSISFPLDG
jgi:hypothetical protein